MEREALSLVVVCTNYLLSLVFLGLHAAHFLQLAAQCIVTELGMLITLP